MTYLYNRFNIFQAVVDERKKEMAALERQKYRQSQICNVL